MELLTLPHSEPSGRAETVSSRRVAVERVISGMRQHLDRQLSLQSMAQLAHLSPFHFDRVFREITGLPPKAFLSAMRLGAAKRLLAETGRSVTDVCFDVGYSSLGSFVARFSQLVGFSPVRWRRAVTSTLSASTSLPHVVPESSAGGGTTVNVEIKAPDGFCGVVFAGLFARPCPQGRPAACAAARGPSTVELRGVPNGLFYLCVAGVPYPLSRAREDQMLRAGGARNPVLVQDGGVSGRTCVQLRPKEPTDPPILFGIPFVVRRASSRRATHGARTTLAAAADRPSVGGTP